MTGFVQELGRAGLYKRTQGKITRQVTWAALFVGVVLGSWQLYKVFQNLVSSLAVPWVVFGSLVVLGAWLCYRLVNYPPFADFLIAVEAEMAKVSWPSRRELIRATVVVLVSMFVLTVVLLLFDVGWSLLLDGLLDISNKRGRTSG